MSRGLPNIRRTHARNYIPVEADLRLKEVTQPYQNQGLNALGVDCYEVLLYLKQMSSRQCTCRAIQVESELGSMPITDIQHTDIGGAHEITMDWKRPLFGEPHEARFEETDGDNIDDYGFDDAEPEPMAAQLIESTPDCGICFRSGFVPGFVQYGKHRTVFTTHDVVDVVGYTVDRSAGPHVFEKLHANACVGFDLHVPKYFKHVSISIRNNKTILDDVLFLDQALTHADLLANRGKTLRVLVRADYFTHVVVVFDLGTEPVYANIAQITKATDWTLFNTIGNLNVVLPMTIPELPTGSIIAVPKHGVVLTVTDTPFLRTADGRNLDWSVNTRVVQPQETTMKIHKSVRLF